VTFLGIQRFVNVQAVGSGFLPMVWCGVPAAQPEALQELPAGSPNPGLSSGAKHRREMQSVRVVFESERLFQGNVNHESPGGVVAPDHPWISGVRLLQILPDRPAGIFVGHRGWAFGLDIYFHHVDVVV
jgi:hypothetical protein